MEKNELMPLIFTQDDLALMERVRAAFNPAGRLNPGKVLPMGKACGEIRVPPTPPSSTIHT
jgi:glycolate oxidase